MQGQPKRTPVPKQRPCSSPSIGRQDLSSSPCERGLHLRRWMRSGISVKCKAWFAPIIPVDHGSRQDRACNQGQHRRPGPPRSSGSKSRKGSASTAYDGIARNGPHGHRHKAAANRYPRRGNPGSTPPTPARETRKSAILPQDLQKPTQECAHSRNRLADCTLGLCPIQDTFITNLYGLLSPPQHVAMPGRRLHCLRLLTQIKPKRFHQTDLVRVGHLFEGKCQSHRLMPFPMSVLP